MSDGTEQAAAPTLLIGEAPGPEGALRIAFAALDSGLLARVGPARVICRLFAPEADAMAVAETLAALGWAGRLTVVAPGLPNRAMVQRELQASAGRVKIEVVPALQG
ncbi:hypothetical protein [Paragemmobacter straminiformis]|uniref:Uncharacterized protein n=1 Tax=Paragemmobacter straminiformis TaxID=2045119 RepID=A0A842I6W0_9RHOB|nr:hypothetical protein [Gemmobacter straminiformis]MBC2835379.1 hypothetical protein [Gemmobacter straminiformis]